MDEVLPGIFHWTAFHEGIRLHVNSHYVPGAGALFDPMLPDEGLEWFEGREPERIVLSNRHHYRHSDRFREAFGCPVLCPEPGLHEFKGGPDVEAYAYGDEVAPGVVAHEAGAICPDDAALVIRAGGGAVLFADGLIHYGEIGFVPDDYMDDPPAVKRGMREAARRLLDEDFDALLFAHGEPLPSGGKDALRRFAEEEEGS